MRNDHSRFDTNWKALLLAETFVDFHKYTEAGKPAPMQGSKSPSLSTICSANIGRERQAHFPSASEVLQELTA